MRISHMIRTMNGKNERIAFAATEKAKVCASVFSKYCSVGTPLRRTIRSQGSTRRRLKLDPDSGTVCVAEDESSDMRVQPSYQKNMIRPDHRKRKSDVDS